MGAFTIENVVGTVVHYPAFPKPQDYLATNLGKREVQWSLAWCKHFAHVAVRSPEHDSKKETTNDVAKRRWNHVAEEAPKGSRGALQDSPRDHEYRRD